MQRFKSLVFPVFLLSFASAAFAQWPMIAYSGGGSYIGGVFQGNASFRFPMPAIPLMANAPYSGQQEIEVSQTLQGGVHVSHPSPSGQKIWRDSQGRIRVEKSLMPGRNRADGVPTLVEIQDPVAGCTYIMDDVHRIAHRIKVSVAPQPNMEERMTRELVGRGSPPQSAARSGSGLAESAPRPAAARRGLANSAEPPQSSLQDLRTQVMDGVLVHGTRIVTVIPAGFSGNDGPITSTRDTWYSPDLNLILCTVLVNHLSSTSTDRVVNLTRNEPDPSLFLVPVDYSIVDESGSFEITWGKLR